MDKISLILTTFNRANLLDLGLSSITKYERKFPLEIVVVNDGVEDETKTICNKYSDKLDIKYYFSGQRNTPIIRKRGPSWAINIGVKKSTGDIVIISCPEMWHVNECIDHAVFPLLSKENVFTTPGWLYYDDMGKLISVLQINKEFQVTDDILKKLTVGGEKIGALRMPYFMGMLRDKFFNVGGYDERFTGYCGDDNDFVDRLQRSGLKIEHTPAKIVHLFHLGTNDGAYHGKNPDWVFNYNLWRENTRNNVIKVNNGIEWGVL